MGGSPGSSSGWWSWIRIPTPVTRSSFFTSVCILTFKIKKTGRGWPNRLIILNVVRWEKKEILDKNFEIKKERFERIGSEYNIFIKRSLLRLFSVFFQQTIEFLQQFNLKKCPNVHPVYSAGIWTPRPFEQESSPITTRPGLPPSEYNVSLENLFRIKK